MSVWKSDEKLLGFASLISPSKFFFFFWRSNIEMRVSIYLEIGAAQLCSVTEIVPRSPFLCVNRNLIVFSRASKKLSIA